MGAGAKVGIAILVLLVLFFLIPLVQYKSTTSSSSGVTLITASGYVSPSFYMFGYGLVLNLQGTGTVFGIQVSQSQSISGFFCNVGAAH